MLNAPPDVLPQSRTSILKSTKDHTKTIKTIMRIVEIVGIAIHSHIRPTFQIQTSFHKSYSLKQLMIELNDNIF
jgi:hypothetical protein